MSEEVLRSYASRAITAEGFCVNSGDILDPIFEENLRMILRTGAKYIGRSAFFSWNWNLSAAQIEQHFQLAKDRAALAHKADSELILQACVFEIVYKGTVNSIAIPDWVFQAFGKTPEHRNFKYDDVIFPAGSQYTTGFWGNNQSAVPDINNPETQMYFYYLIRRYIDAGYESVHLGQAEMDMNYQNINNAVAWDKVLTLARIYAKTQARRGIILFDAHSAIDSPGLKVGNRLLLDIQAAALCPNETTKVNGAEECQALDSNAYWLSWIGRSAGGEHPLGFHIDHLITILEMGNDGLPPADSKIKPGTPTPSGFWDWGYDDITWFALQPGWYRNQFLLETNAYLKKNDLDSQGKQVYFLQPPLFRIHSGTVTLTYKPGKSCNTDFFFDFISTEKIKPNYDSKTNTFTLTVPNIYRANRQSDGCPDGFGQEDTVRQIFLGKNAPENPSLLKVVLPPKYSSATSTLGNSTVVRNSTASGSSSALRSESSLQASKPGSSALASSIVTESYVTSSVGTHPESATKINATTKHSSLLWIIGIIVVLLVFCSGGLCWWHAASKKKSR